MTITNLVFEGGGVLGVAFVGALRYISEKGILPGITRMAGSSAGSFVALALTLGYSVSEISEILMSLDFAKFEDDSYGVIRDLHRLKKDYGLCKGDTLHAWIQELIFGKMGTRNITFSELYTRTGIFLVITGTCLNKQKTVFFNKDTTPDMDVSLAVRISSCIPIFFRAVRYQGDLYIDGGVLMNYPLYVFDDVSDVSETLGFKLTGSNEHRDNEIIHADTEVDSLYKFIETLIGMLLLKIEQASIKDNYYTRTVTVNTWNMSSTNFKISTADKQKLIASGWDSTETFFNGL